MKNSPFPLSATGPEDKQLYMMARYEKACDAGGKSSEGSAVLSPNICVLNGELLFNTMPVKLLRWASRSFLPDLTGCTFHARPLSNYKLYSRRASRPNVAPQRKCMVPARYCDILVSATFALLTS